MDSGGQGLLEIVKELMLFLGEILPKGSGSEETAPSGINIERIASEDIKFGYCTEFIIMLRK